MRRPPRRRRRERRVRSARRGPPADRSRRHTANRLQPPRPPAVSPAFEAPRAARPVRRSSARNSPSTQHLPSGRPLQLLPAAAAGPRLVARALVPSADPDEVSRRQALTAEAVALLDISAEPPLGGIDDVRGTAALAARGGVLTPDALRKIAAAIAGGLRARTAVESE